MSQEQRRPRPRMFDLVALNESAMETMNLGDAADPQFEAPRYRVLIYALFWGAWKGARVRVVSSGGGTVAACEDVTSALCLQYLARHGRDEEVRRLGHPVRNDQRPGATKNTKGREVINIGVIDVEVIEEDED